MPLCLVAHDCGYPLSRYTCRATRVAADFLDFIAFCRCSTGVALHPLKILVSHLPPPVPGGVAPKFGSEKVSRYTGVSQLQLRVSRYTVQLSPSVQYPSSLWQKRALKIFPIEPIQSRIIWSGPRSSTELTMRHCFALPSVRKFQGRFRSTLVGLVLIRAFFFD